MSIKTSSTLQMGAEEKTNYERRENKL